jgi:transcriptional regulator with XRE-family HTH domain
MLNRNDLYGYSNRQILTELGKSIQCKRLNLNIKQSELAERCGISLSTINGLEKGRNTSLDTFIAVLRELREFDALYLSFLKEEPIAPDVMLKLTKNQRLRARKSKIGQP